MKSQQKDSRCDSEVNSILCLRFNSFKICQNMQELELNHISAKLKLEHLKP